MSAGSDSENKHTAAGVFIISCKSKPASGLNGKGLYFFIYAILYRQSIFNIKGGVYMEEKNENPKKKIEIVKGSSKDLNISEVRDNLAFENHEDNKKNNIVIPETLINDEENDNN